MPFELLGINLNCSLVVP